MCKVEKRACPRCSGDVLYAGVENKKQSFKCTNCEWQGPNPAILKISVDYRNIKKKCNFCGADEGNFHDYMCGMEFCPFCGSSLSNCNCCYTKLGYDPENLPEEIYNNYLDEEDQQRFKKIVQDKGRVLNIHYPNMCAKCGVLWPITFMVSTEEWQRFVPSTIQRAMLCHKCYEEIKESKIKDENFEISFPILCHYCGKTNPAPNNADKKEWESYIEIRMRKSVICQVCFEFIKDLVD
ncbi:hypothetical protein LCGC14_1408160, partial [marine sediment metagenome]